MRVQLQCRYPDGERDFVAQTDIDDQSPDASRELQSWLDDVRSRHPLPNGAQWWVVNEASKYFFYQVAADSASE